jgi:hypothetical protein
MSGPETDDIHAFERRLGRLFDEAPAYPDEALFAARVAGKLETRNQVRSMIMGLAGGAGAFIAVGQLFRANFAGEYQRLADASAMAYRQGLAELNRDAGGLLASVPLEGEVMWTVAALGALALSALLARVADQG